jgi:hypothetical protein
VFARKDKNTGSNSGRAFFALFFASKRILAVFLPPDLHHKILCEQSYFDPANRTYSNPQNEGLKTTTEIAHDIGLSKPPCFFASSIVPKLLSGCVTLLSF